MCRYGSKSTATIGKAACTFPPLFPRLAPVFIRRHVVSARKCSKECAVRSEAGHRRDVADGQLGRAEHLRRLFETPRTQHFARSHSEHAAKDDIEMLGSDADEISKLGNARGGLPLGALLKIDLDRSLQTLPIRPRQLLRARCSRHAPASITALPLLLRRHFSARRRPARRPLLGTSDRNPLLLAQGETRRDVFPPGQTGHRRRNLPGGSGTEPVQGAGSKTPGGMLSRSSKTRGISFRMSLRNGDSPVLAARAVGVTNSEQMSIAANTPRTRPLTFDIHPPRSRRLESAKFVGGPSSSGVPRDAKS